MGKEIEKPKLHISQNDFVDITTTNVTTPAVSAEIEHQVETSEQFEIVIDKQQLDLKYFNIKLFI